MFVQLNTERLLIREFKPTDLDAVYEYSSDPEVTKYMPFEPNTLEIAKKFLKQAIKKQKMENRTDYEMAVVLQEENKVIGGCRINKETGIQAHIGYILNQNYWGHGYASEVAKALVAYGFNEMEVHRVYATCDPDNGASRRVLEKTGMILEGRLRENMMSRGMYRDSLVLAVLKPEWERT